jgi:hypothetical protein
LRDGIRKFKQRENKSKSSKSEKRFTAGLKLEKLGENKKESEKEEEKGKEKQKEANPEKESR